MLKILAMLMPMLMVWVPAMAQEKLGPDGFPVDWGDEAFAVGVSETQPADFAPKTFRIDQLKKVSIAPSGSVPMALPPVQSVSKSAVTSGSSFVPLGAAFAPAAPSNAVQGVRTVSASLPPETNNLGASAGFGVLNSGNGGVPELVWQNSGLQRITLEKPKKGSQPAPKAALAGAGLVSNVVAPSIREGWRRLLLSEAPEPSPTLGPVNWLAVRANGLEQAGWHEAAWTLWRAPGAQARQEDADVMRGWVAASLLAGETGAACALAKEQAAAQAGDWWNLTMAVCTAIEAQGGGTGQLGLSLQLVPKAEAARNPRVMDLLHALSSGKPRGVGAGEVTWDALSGALAAAYPSLLTSEDMAVLPDVVLRRLRESSTLPDDLRIPAARALAARTGWVPDGVALVGMVAGGVISGTTPDAAVLAWADKNPKAVSATEAGLVVRAALRLGNPELAGGWMARWQIKNSKLVEARRARADAEVILEGMRGEVSGTVLERWMVAQELGNVAGSARAQRVLAAVDGLGAEVPEEIWQNYRARAVAADDGVDGAWRRLLARAVELHQVPRVLQLVSEGLKGQGADVAPAGVIGESVAALRTVGMNDVAARLAAEAVLGGYVAPGNVPKVVVSGIVSTSMVTPTVVSASAVSATVVSATVVSVTRVLGSSAKVGVFAPLPRKPAYKGGTFLPPPRVNAPSRPVPPVKPKGN